MTSGDRLARPLVVNNGTDPSWPGAHRLQRLFSRGRKRGSKWGRRGESGDRVVKGYDYRGIATGRQGGGREGDGGGGGGRTTGRVKTSILQCWM